jgi:hypothetical protein
MDLVRDLPEDPPLETLMSHSALKATIISIYDLRMSDIMDSATPQELVSRDSIFDSIANYFNRQFAGDGDETFMPELMEIDGPVARLLMSCRCAAALHLRFPLVGTELNCKSCLVRIASRNVCHVFS